jgi:anaerobic selenocysteine-containing dehydrogenase
VLELGLGALPDFLELNHDSNIRDLPNVPSLTKAFPLSLTRGRTLAHFHSFYNNGRELPTLAKREKQAHLWISPLDATSRNILHGVAISIFNQRGMMSGRAHVTEKIAAGTVWMRDGWPGLNSLSEGKALLPDAAVDRFAFSAGQATYDGRVEVARDEAYPWNS